MLNNWKNMKNVKKCETRRIFIWFVVHKLPITYKRIYEFDNFKIICVFLTIIRLNNIK
jgi:hypothetical protein